MLFYTLLVASAFTNGSYVSAFFQPTSFTSRATNGNSKSQSLLMSAEPGDKTKIVVIGNGMVGQRFMENILSHDKGEKFSLATFCEEKRAAYNRVKLTSYFDTRNPSDLSMTDDYDEDGKTAWFDENGVEIFLGEKAVSIDTEKKTITGSSGKEMDYDVAVLATGSYRKFS
jgi:nitrite reductase (NADH) large subunit